MNLLGGGKKKQRQQQRQQQRGRMPKMTKGTIDSVPCPYPDCRKFNDFRDLAPDMPGGATGGIPGGHGGEIEVGELADCDHCKRPMEISGVRKTTLIQLRMPVRG